MKLQGIQVWDNGGKTCDRYTVRIGKSIFAMNSQPLSASGYNMFAGNFADWQPGPTDEEVGPGMVPVEVTIAIFKRAWPDAMRGIHNLILAIEKCSQRFRTAYDSCEDMKVNPTFVHWLLTCSQDAAIIADQARKEYEVVEKITLNGSN